MSQFDRFLAIDWSGAMGERQRGIQIAYLDRTQGSDPVLLRLPDSKNWGRVVVKNLIAKLARADQRTLVGLDFSFAVPWPEDEGPLPDTNAQLSTINDLWELVDNASGGEPHFYAGPVVRSMDSPFAPYILCDRYRGNDFRFDRYRYCEQLLSPKPASIYHCMGAKQVGPGSFAGMRMFHALRGMNDPRIAIWPFDPIDNANVVLCEAYPSLYFQMARVKRAADAETIRHTLDYFGAGGPPQMTIQDEVDAVIAVAALRTLSFEPELFTEPYKVLQSQKEGWIFGVTAN